MSHVETIAVHFVGYNLLHGAVNEVSGSLRLVRDLSNQTGTTMTQWNQRITATTNEVALAQTRYADILRSTQALIVNAAQAQAAAWLKSEAAHNAVTAAIERQIKAEADLVLIASRTYTDADRLDMVTAANNRLAIATGDRAIAQQAVVAADNELMAADTRVAVVEERAAAVRATAATQVIAAEEAKTIAVRGAALTQIGYLTSASTAAIGVGTGFLVGAGVVAAALAYATSKASSFISDINLLHTQARVATSQLPELSAGILQMAGAVGFSADELTKALYLIESVGGGSMTAAHALRELQAAALGAAVGHASLTATANALASVMAVFPKLLPIQAMGQLDAIVGQGKMTMEDLNGALRTGILATLHSANISLGDFGGALATMTDYGIPAIQAANSLRMAIYLMTAPTIASDKVLKIFGLTVAEASSAGKKFSDAFAEVGIRHAKLADDLAKPGGIILALQDLRTQMLKAGLDAQGQVEVIYKAFGGGKMGKAVVTLYENIAGGARASDAELAKLGFTVDEIATLHDRLIQKTALINKQINLLGQNFSFLLANDPTQMWNNFTASINALIVSLGEVFIPILMRILGFITPIISGITGWIASHKELAGTILSIGLVLATVFGSAMILVGALGLVGGAIAGIAAGASVMAPIAGVIFAGLAIAAGILTGVVILATGAWGAMSDLWSRRVEPSARRLWNSIQSVWTIIQSGLAITKPLFDKAFADFNQSLNENGGLWANATSAFQNFSNSIVTFIKSPFFAALVADFAVGLPVAIGLSLGALLIFIDELQIAMTMAVTATKVAFDLMKGDVIQAGKDVEEGAGAVSDTTQRMWQHMREQSEREGKLLNGSYQKDWNDVYNTTQNWQNKIGADGAIAITKSGTQIINSEHLVMGQLRAQIALDGQSVGQSFGDGILSGMVQREQAIHNQSEKMIYAIKSASLRAAEAGSPSELMAREVGAPLVQGVEMGMEREFPALFRTFGTLMVSLADTPTATPGANFTPVPVTHVTEHATHNDDLLKEISQGIQQLIAGKYQGPTTGLEALVYELTRRVDDQRARGQKGYRT